MIDIAAGAFAPDAARPGTDADGPHRGPVTVAQPDRMTDIPSGTAGHAVGDHRSGHSPGVGPPSGQAGRRVRALTSLAKVSLGGAGLRDYQLAPARAILDSVAAGRGDQFAVVFSRQAGKDELLAQLVAVTLLRYRVTGGSVVMAAPTFRPQAALSRDRLLDRLGWLVGRHGGVRSRDGYQVHLGRASARFLSAAPTANARGQTASLLLVANEAQDIDPAVWDAIFDPMAASTNATTLYMGTVWDRNGLLHRQMTHLDEVEAAGGGQRVFRVPWQVVAAELPAYGDRVRARIAQLGAEHPFIRTEYCLEPLAGDGGLFPTNRIAHLRGTHPRQRAATPGRRYALLLDVAGEEEDPQAGQVTAGGTGRRDSTALTVVEVVPGDGEGGPDSAVIPALPVYRVVDRRTWTGVRHVDLHAEVVDLARHVWRASAVVVDATGIGAGLASFLAESLGRGSRATGPRIPVHKFTFSGRSKSDLGWEFVALIDAGRFKDYADDGDALTRLFYEQLAATTFTTLPGPGRLLRWEVPAGRGHDDLVISAALAATLDTIDWRPRRAIGSPGAALTPTR